jgi:hypothetical protein
MKKIFILCFSLFINLSFSQTELSPILDSPQSPGVSSLLMVEPINVNENRGKPNISIPIIKTEFINYPINVDLVYNSDGLKVNSESSWVGNSWSLNYGGLITRQIKGQPDEENLISKYDNRIVNYWNSSIEQYDFCKALDIIQGESFINSNDDAHNFNEYFYNNNGYITNNIGHQEFSMPDIFNYTLPNGASGQFIFDNRSSGANFILDSNSFKVNYTINSLDNSLESFSITDNAGYQYLFNEAEKSTIGNRSSSNIRSTPRNGYHTQPQSYWVGDVAPYVFCQEGGNYSDEGSNDLYFKKYNMAWHLKEITLPNGGDIITFQYQTFTHGMHTPVESNLGPVNSNLGPYAIAGGSKVNVYKEYQVKTLSKIESKEGEIEFKLSGSVRQDVEENSQLKSLDEVIFKDKNDNLIKKVVFNTSYKNSGGINNIPSSPGNYELYYKRLWLEGITIYNVHELPLSYSFKYNSNPLPSRISLEQDYWGFYNGNGSDGDDTMMMIPDMWYYPDDSYSYSRVSNFSIFRRFNFIGQEYHLSNENYPESFISQRGGNHFANRESNLLYTKSGVLEEIEYPTGGKLVIEYELNDFLVEDQVLTGNGLRVSKTYLTDNNQNISETLYEYKNSSGSTSGKVLAVPVFGAEEFWSTNGTIATIRYVYSSIQNGYEDLGVYYETVTKKIFGNGKVVSKYDIPINIESENGFWDENHQQYFYQKNYDITNSSNHTLGKMYSKSRPITYNLKYLLGDLLERRVYDEQNTLKKEDIYTYKFSNKSKKYYFAEKYLSNLIDSKLNTVLIAKKKLKKTTSKDYFNSPSNVLNEKEYKYNNHSIISEINSINPNGDEIKQKFYYSSDTEVSSMPYMSILMDSHRISEKIKEETFYNNQKTRTQLKKYHNFGNGIILPKEIQISKGSGSLEDQIVFSKYDNKGNPLEISKKDGVKEYYVWGYNQTLLIAKIEGYTSSINSTHQTAINNAISASDNDNSVSTETNLRAKLVLLRKSFSSTNALVTTFTHDPLIGVTSITDPRDETIYYQYDESNRLEFVRDAQGKILSKNEYSYKN